MDPRLEIKLADNSPKCWTCAHYGNHPGRAMDGSGDCDKHTIRVLNLSVCTDWNERIELEAIADA